MIPLSPKKRSELRAAAHKLNPLVIIGDKGLTDEVLAEIDRSLRAHELLKVRAATDDREARDAWLETVCERLGAHPVQQIGKVFVVYRENPKEAKRKPEEKSGPGLRRDDKRSGDDKRRGDDKRHGDDKRRGDDKPPREASTGTSRPRSRTPSPRPASEPRRRRPRTSR